MGRSRSFVAAGTMLTLAVGAGVALVGSAWQAPRVLAAAQDAPAAAVPAARDAAAPDAKVPPRGVLRLYDISDITEGLLPAQMPSSVLPPSALEFFGGRERWNGLFCGNLNESREPKRLGAIEFDAIAGLLAEEVDPAVAETIRQHNGLLAVRADAATHERVSVVLRQIRSARPIGKGVEVTAHWVLLDPDKLATLYKADSREVDPKKLATLPPGTLYARLAGRTVTGQPITLVGGRARTMITDQDANIGQATAAYDPTVSHVLSGFLAAIDFRVIGDAATAHVAAAAGDWDQPGKPARIRSFRGGPSQPEDAEIDVPERANKDDPPPRIKVPAPSPRLAAAEDNVAEVDRLNVVVAHLHTTAKLPLGKPTLVGGMTLEPATGATSSKGDPRQLYLILEVNLAETP